MEGEGMHLLNLSPIPEFTEVDLSTVLEQLSGLSELNSEMTDRNVEDILKEAEELIDKSSSSKSNESKCIVFSTKKDNNKKAVGDECNREIENGNKEEEENCSHADSTLSEQDSSKIIESDNKQNTFLGEKAKLVYSPRLQDTHALFSSINSTNHIKSTIDSLKEFSNLIEKQFSEGQISPSSSSSRDANRKSNRNREKKLEKDLVTTDDSISEKPKLSTKTNLEAPRLKENKAETLGIDKSIKMLTCFERLYKGRPLRLSGNLRKPKLNEKAPRVVVKKKPICSKLFENAFVDKLGKYNEVNKCSAPQTSGHKLKEDTKPIRKKLVKEAGVEEQEKKDCSAIMKQNIEDTCFTLKPELEMQHRCDCDTKSADGEILYSPRNDSSAISNQQKIKDKLLLKLLEEMAEIKNQIQRTGHGHLSDRAPHSEDNVSSSDCPSRPSPGHEDSPDGKISHEAVKRDGISRLEEQFYTLKTKYDQQIEKLEKQNVKLKEELKIHQKVLDDGNDENKQVISCCGVSEEQKEASSSITTNNSGANIKSRSVSPDNCRAPRNSPVGSSIEQEPSSSLEVKEAFSQTESVNRNVSVQCVKEDVPPVVAVDVPRNKVSSGACGKMAENKENLSLGKNRKSYPKTKPFSDMNVHPRLNKKLTSEYEFQLMATLRGLKAELADKDKENRKLKAEIDVLRAHIKRLGKVKIEGSKKVPVGTQTIGLGPVVQRPYNPEVYEVKTNEFERENEELKARIKALEDSFELLKEKRINDLQALHQVHEKEISKLVSKLETQSALTKHLHAMLMNR